MKKRKKRTSEEVPQRNAGKPFFFSRRGQLRISQKGLNCGRRGGGGLQPAPGARRPASGLRTRDEEGGSHKAPSQEKEEEKMVSPFPLLLPSHLAKVAQRGKLWGRRALAAVPVVVRRVR